MNYKTKNLEGLKTSELKKLCDYEFRQLLLFKAERHGLGLLWCPLRGTYHAEGEMHVSHFIDRHHMHLRYDEDNCHLISAASNMWDSKEPYEGYKSLHHYEYEKYLRNKIGDKKVDKLLDNKINLSIFGRQRYIKLINEYREQTKTV